MQLHFDMKTDVDTPARKGGLMFRSWDMEEKGMTLGSKRCSEKLNHFSQSVNMVILPKITFFLSNHMLISRRGERLDVQIFKVVKVQSDLQETKESAK